MLFWFVCGFFPLHMTVGGMCLGMCLYPDKLFPTLSLQVYESPSCYQRTIITTEVEIKTVSNRSSGSSYLASMSQLPAPQHVPPQLLLLCFQKQNNSRWVGCTTGICIHGQKLFSPVEMRALWATLTFQQSSAPRPNITASHSKLTLPTEILLDTAQWTYDKTGRTLRRKDHTIYILHISFFSSRHSCKWGCASALGMCCYIII